MFSSLFRVLSVTKYPTVDGLVKLCKVCDGEEPMLRKFMGGA